MAKNGTKNGQKRVKAEQSSYYREYLAAFGQKREIVGVGQSDTANNRSRRVLICTIYDNISLFIWYCTYPGSGLHLYHLKIPFTGGCSEGLGVF